MSFFKIDSGTEIVGKNSPQIIEDFAPTVDVHEGVNDGAITHSSF